MNTDELALGISRAERRVREIQTKLHRWACDDTHRRFDDLFNLVCDPAFLLVAWDRVRGNKGARTAGMDGQTAFTIEAEQGVEVFLDGLRSELKDLSFRPVPVRERMIPKANGKRRRLGIATVTDRVVQASLKLVLEPVFEADFLPCSYGFRPKRRAHDAVAEVRHFTARSYEWVLEGDIEACFDEISHTGLLDRVRRRIGDKRVLALVKAFLKAGILTEGGVVKDMGTGTPQGGILSPVLANVALSVLDEHFVGAPGGPAATTYERTKRRRRGLPNCRLVRYADDWCLVVSGTAAHAEAYRDEAAEVLSAMGLRLSPEKTAITHIDEGLDFLGWRIQRRRKRGTSKHYLYTYPARKSVASVTTKVKTLCRQNINLPLEVLLHRLNSLLRGWTAYFRPGVSSAAFNYLRALTWRQVVAWLRRKHSRITWKELRRRFFAGAGGPPSVRSSCSTPPRSPPRATATAAPRFPHPGRVSRKTRIAPTTGLVESRMRRRGARPVRRAARGNGPMETSTPRPAPTQPPQGPPGAIQGVPAGDDRGARRRHQGTGGSCRWVSRVHRVLGRRAAVVSPARDDRTGARGQRRGTGVLEGAAGGIPRYPRAAVLVPRQLQRPCRPAEVGAPRREGRARRDLQRRRHR